MMFYLMIVVIKTSQYYTLKYYMLKHYQNGYRRRYLLVIKLLETMFKLVIPGLHSLPQSLQHLQEKHKEAAIKGYHLRRLSFEKQELVDYYLFFASAQLPLDFFSKVTRAAFWTLRHISS